MEKLRTSIKRHQLASFFVIAFGWSWMYDGIVFFTVGSSPGILVRGLVRTWGPLIAGVTVIWAGEADLRSYLGQITKWRVKYRWYIFAIVLPFLLDGSLAVSAVHLLDGGDVRIAPSPWWLYIGGFFVVMFLMGGLEEFGWRGFAQPRLQEQYSALAAAVGIGILWAFWHFPLFYLFDVAAYETSSFWTTYLFTLIVQSIIYAWLYNSTGGGLLFPMLAHSVGNLPPLFEPVGGAGRLAHLAPDLLSILFIVALIGFYGRKYLSSSMPEPRTPGVPSEMSK